jgi:hypothetical protein
LTAKRKIHCANCGGALPGECSCVSDIPDLSKLQEVMSVLATQTATELMESWHRGFCDGLEMAAKLADGMSDHFAMSESQQVVLRAVRDFLREFQLKAQLDK